MKNSFLRTVLLLLWCTTLQQCSEDGQSADPENVPVTFSLTTSDIADGRTEAQPFPSALLISLVNNAGQPVLTNKKVTLLPIGDGFLTEPLSLPPGHYKISDFFLVLDTDVIVYAVPKRGSPLEKAVIHPLPYSFSVFKNKLTNIDMEVVHISRGLPEDFGYASFNINAVNPLRLSVFTSDYDVNLTSAKVFIIHDGDTIEHYSLNAAINVISFKGDPEIPHTLVVTKNGYNPYVLDFVYNTLAETLDNLSLKVYLYPPLTMRTTGEYPPFHITLGGPPNKIRVDWGDGSVDTYVTPETTSSLEHSYPSVGDYRITITGDLDHVTDFYSFYGQGDVSEIDLRGLQNLKEIRFGLSSGPKILNLTHNTKIESLMLTGLRNLEQLLLPSVNHISYLDLTGPNHIETAAVDAIILKIYHAVEANNTRDGAILLLTNFMPPVSDGLVGSPSPSSILKLTELRDNYGWFINPPL